MPINSIRIKDKFNFGKKYLEAVNRVISFPKEEFMERWNTEIETK